MSSFELPVDTVGIINADDKCKVTMNSINKYYVYYNLCFLSLFTKVMTYCWQMTLYNIKTPVIVKTIEGLINGEKRAKDFGCCG